MVTTFRAVSTSSFWNALNTRLAPLLLAVRENFFAFFSFLSHGAHVYELPQSCCTGA